jgi:hypothetical protein
MLDRRIAITAGVYSLAAAATTPAFSPSCAASVNSTGSAGQADIARIRRMTAIFADLDDRHGGGHARSAIAAYFTHDVAPLLRSTTGRTRPELFAAASQLAYLAAWMAADAGHSGLAQRYYGKAVLLADEADDPLLRANALRSIAVQAIERGHSRTGLALADAAARSLPPDAPLRHLAWITGLTAEATAADGGDPHQARRLLHQTETYLDRADSPGNQLFGNYQRPSFEHQVGLTLAALGDLPTAERHLTASVTSRTASEQRTRALIGSRLAAIQLRRRRPEAAAHTLLALTTDLDAVTSTRVHGTLAGIQTAWRPYLSDPTVAAADQLLSTTLPPAM